MKFIQRFSSQPKFVCACLFLLLGQTLASIKQAKKTNNEITSSIISNQNEPEIERIPVIRDSAGDIVIESFDDGLLSASSIKGSNDRHHYEQPAIGLTDPQKQPQEPQTQQVAPDQPTAATEAPLASLVIEEISPAATSNSKPEPRNHQEDQHPETVVIDHRPTGSLEQPSAASVTHAVASSASSGSTQDYSHQSNGNQQPSSAGSGAQPASAAHQVHSSQQQQQQQQQHTTGGQPVVGWHSANNHQSGPLQLSQHQFNQQPVAASSLQSSNFGNSNQAQHPTSINSIINDPQNQGTLINPAGPQYQAASSQAAATLAANPAGGQQAATNMMSLNGQPVYFVNPSGQVALGGRRISNWLRGISSMLASIFNRREHGNQVMSGQASSPNGHWIQLGPNAPHWLTQAQSMIQQQQQQFQQQFGTIAGSGNNNNPSQQQLLGSASTNRYPTFVQAPQTASQQPQQPATLQASAILSGQPQHQLLPASYPVSVSSSNGDLQASSSSNSYVTVQHPPNQQQSQLSGPTANLAQYQQPSAPVGASFGFQSPPAAMSPQLVQTAGSQQQQVASRQSAPAANVEQPRPSFSSSATSNGSQPATVWSPAAPPPQSSNAASQSQPRFSRSSSSLASASQNLPLAHYSRYAVSEQ